MAQCQAFTKKEKRCVNGDATIDEKTGTFLCHLHHPARLFRQQVAAKRKPRLTPLNLKRPVRTEGETKALEDRC